MEDPMVESAPIVSDDSSSSGRHRVWKTVKDSRWMLGGLLLFAIFLSFKSFMTAALAAGLTLLALRIITNDVDPDIGAMIVGGGTFLFTWGACVASYGFLFGFGLGWLPAYILAQMFMWLWNVVAVVALAAAVIFALSL